HSALLKELLKIGFEKKEKSLLLTCPKKGKSTLSKGVNIRRIGRNFKIKIGQKPSGFRGSA
uniref:hypothetical protein n=1 Tax=Carboxylicivirga fragile TaxID=3417571 RepID=UPI003D34259B|nr:hypothetical protein [Marinilabiliaceae bacterium N1Y90]